MAEELTPLERAWLGQGALVPALTELIALYKKNKSRPSRRQVAAVCAAHGLDGADMADVKAALATYRLPRRR